MKNWILFLILMVCGKNYAQVPPLVVGSEVGTKRLSKKYKILVIKSLNYVRLKYF